MNDNDIQEQLLLNALDDNQIQQNQQRYNFNYDDSIDNNNNNNHRSNYRSHNSRSNHYREQHFDHRNNYHHFDCPEPTQSYEPYDLEPNQISGNVSLGSLSPEEFLENFDFNGDGNNNNNNDSTETMITDTSIDDSYSEPNTNKKPVKKLSRKITFCEKEVGSKPGLVVASKSAPPTHQRSKSAASVASIESNDSSLPVRVENPTDDDILCGQSRVCANHPGNRYFQSVLDEFAGHYDLATSKQEKMCMTKEIVCRIHHNRGRFLKQKKDGFWEEISTVAARDKVSHALRTKVAGWKRNQEQQEQRGSSVTPPGGGRRSSMSRSSIKLHRRRTSNNSATSCPEPSSSSSDIVPIPFDGDDASSEHVLSGLMKSQKEIYATMNSLWRGNTMGDNNNNYQQPSSHRHSFPTYHGNNHYRMER